MKVPWILLAALCVLPHSASPQVLEPPSPLTVQRTQLTQMEDGTVRHSQETFVEETRVSRVVLRPDGLVCELWKVDAQTQQLLRGQAACEQIFGQRAPEVLALAERLAQAPQDVRGPAWTCSNDAILRLEEYNSCHVTFTEYDEEGERTTEERTFSFHELDYAACVNWCMVHWQEDGYLGDFVRTCGGGHETGDHPGYVPPESS